MKNLAIFCFALTGCLFGAAVANATAVAAPAAAEQSSQGSAAVPPFSLPMSGAVNASVPAPPLVILNGDPDDIDRVQRLRVGFTTGRTGAAYGCGPLLEFNPTRFLGLYGFVATSRIDNYVTQGVSANLRDRQAGFGIVIRWLEVGPLTMGPFAQAAYYGSNVTAIYHDPAYGTVTYRDHDISPVVTVGSSIEWRIKPWISAFVRPGKNFGSNFPSQTAGGLSFNGGVLIGVKPSGHAISRAYRHLFR